MKNPVLSLCLVVLLYGTAAQKRRLKAYAHEPTHLQVPGRRRDKCLRLFGSR